MAISYPPLDVAVHTPQLSLVGATDELLRELAPIVRAGVLVSGEPLPFDDPMSLYKDSPAREWEWMRAIWSGRSRVTPSFWRLYFVVVVDGEAIGMQDLIGMDFATYGTVDTFSWLAPTRRRRGLGSEMRAAVLQLAFDGFGATEATSGAFLDNIASNRVSEKLGYQPNGVDWATRRDEPAEICRWRLRREEWTARRRSDMTLTGVEACRPVLGMV